METATEYLPKNTNRKRDEFVKLLCLFLAAGLHLLIFCLKVLATLLFAALRAANKARVSIAAEPFWQKPLGYKIAAIAANLFWPQEFFNYILSLTGLEERRRERATFCLCVFVVCLWAQLILF